MRHMHAFERGRAPELAVADELALPPHPLLRAGRLEHAQVLEQQRGGREAEARPGVQAGGRQGDLDLKEGVAAVILRLAAASAYSATAGAVAGSRAEGQQRARV